MKLLFMGPPGAGKGTQAKFISSQYNNIPQISTGEILRASIKAGKEVGLKAQEYMKAGKLVPDEVVIDIIKIRIAEPDAQNGYILDGFPRTVEQADALEKILSDMGQGLDVALNLDVPDEEIIKRLYERAKKEGRVDDTEEVIKERLENYNKQTLPLIEYYKKKNLLKNIDGLGDMNQVTERMKAILEKFGKE